MANNNFQNCQFERSRKIYFFKIKFAESKNRRIFAFPFREHSSVGLEHLPYKQRVGGSTPSAPTKEDDREVVLFSYIPSIFLDAIGSHL